MHKICKINLEARPGSTVSNKTGTWKTYTPAVDHEICIGCGNCAMVCPEGVCFAAEEKNSKGKIFYDNDLDYCKGCGICAEECPVKAIKMILQRRGNGSSLHRQYL